MSPRAFLIPGDSIAGGTATSPSYADIRAGGPIVRACKVAGVGYINIAYPGEQAQQFVPATWQRRNRFLDAVTDVLCQHGTNDCHQTGRTFAQVAVELQRIWKFYGTPLEQNGRGKRVTQLTITPRTTSTDGWSTLANQTVHAQNPVRIAVNAWLRAGAPQDVNGLAVAPGTAGAVPNPILARGYAGAGMVTAGVWDWLPGFESSTDSGKIAVSTGNAILTNASTAITITGQGAVRFQQGQPIYGTGIPAGAYLNVFNPTTGVGTISAAATAGDGVTPVAVTGQGTGDGTHPREATGISMSVTAAPGLFV